MRADIQALRAAAVLLVVVYHFSPALLPGGFVGVDAFFVISGYLITGHLVREADRSGTVALGAFWARRAWRLLPASLTTLAVCSVATLAVVPEVHWQAFLADVRASTFYAQNWHLAATSVDYLRAVETPSPVQHFWSLSAEEQFYVAWPLLIVGACLAARRSGAVERRRRITALLGAATAASFLTSVVLTSSDPAAAYFVTPTRAWEFGAGGLLALSNGRALGAAARALLSWGGLVVLVASAGLFSSETAFPGFAALAPVLATAAVIRAGAVTGPFGTEWLFARRPVQFFGDLSYSLYLWHWPLLILAPFVAGRAIGDGARILVLLAAVGAAAFSKAFIEDPARHSRRVADSKARWTFVAAAAGMFAVAGIAWVGTRTVEGRLREARTQTERTLSDGPRCFGAASRDPRQRCVNRALQRTVAPSPLEARNEPNPPCRSKTKLSSVTVCEFGVRAEAARRTFALIGDSHATHWRAGLETVAERLRWQGLSITRTGCPFSRAVYDLPEPGRSRCVRWNREVVQTLARYPQVDTVMVSNITGGRVERTGGRSMAEAKLDGYRAAYASLPSNVKHIVVLRDTPKAHTTTLDCVTSATADGRSPGPACAVPRRTAIEVDPAAQVARSIGPPRAQVVDMSSFFCGRRRCDAVIGGVLVYKDAHHITREFSTTLGPYLTRKIKHLAAAWAAR